MPADDFALPRRKRWTTEGALSTVSILRMKSNVFPLIVSGLWLLSGGAPASGQDDDAAGESASTTDSWRGRTVVLAIGSDDLADGRRLREIERILEKAESDEAGAIVYEIDTPEPAPWSARRRVLDLLGEVTLPSAAYVNSNGTGVGALIALAADTIFLAPSGIVGGAGIAESESDSGDEETDGDAAAAQRRSVLGARARSLARIHGHRPEVAEAFIDGDAEVVIGGETLTSEGEVLTLTAEEAVRRIDGEPVLGEAIVGSIGELIDQAGLPAERVRLTPREFGEAFNRARLSEMDGDEGKESDDPAASSKEQTGDDEDEALFGRREAESYEGKVVVIEVGQDTLSAGKASFDFMDRTLKKAELDGATAVIFDMDTPGGLAWYTEGLVLDALQNVSLPTYTFVNPRAESAGAIIALGTDHIYMRPAATIGSALVVSGTGQDLPEAMSDKVTQMIIGTVRNIAELNGHNPDVAEAFVTRDKEVKIDGVVIHEAGNVLNLNTIDATEEVGGRPVLAKGVAQDLEGILEAEGLDGEIVRAERLGMEAFAHWVQKLSVLLIVIGLAGAYLELNSPGFGLPGLISVTTFSLFFFGNYMAGNLAGYELAVLLVLGLVLIGVEIFLFPGAIIPGAVGGALVLVALGLAMVDRVDLEWKWNDLPGAESWFAIFREAIFTVAAGLVGALGLAMLGMRYLPQTRLGSRFILQEAVAGGASLPQSPSKPAAGGVEESRGKGESSLVGREGETTTDLLPSGKGNFGGRLLDIVSGGEFIGKGQTVRVVSHEGSRVVVEKA